MFGIVIHRSLTNVFKGYGAGIMSDFTINANTSQNSNFSIGAPAAPAAEPGKQNAAAL